LISVPGLDATGNVGKPTIRSQSGDLRLTQIALLNGVQQNRGFHSERARREPAEDVWSQMQAWFSKYRVLG